jgi:hypothetical protein
MPRKKSQERLAREFGFMWPVFCGILTLIMVAPKYIGFLWWEPKLNAVVPLLSVGFGLLAISLVLPKLWLLFFRFWMHWFTRPLAWVMTRVILSVFFFLIMTPFVALLRLFGIKFLDNRWKDGKETYWRPREAPEYTIERYRKQF